MISNVIELFLVFHGVIGVIHSSKNVFSSYPVDFDVTECAIPTMYGMGYIVQRINTWHILVKISVQVNL